jgi:YD repeat-containing protein
VYQWTYNQYGQVLTATDPLSHTTTYAYYSDTTADHTMGDLQSVTNALSQVTQFTKYNPHGQVLQMVDANNVTTDYQNDLRQRLKSVSTAGQTTTYDYWPTGLLKQVNLPDSSYISYTYDDAHRLTDIADNLGNSVHYTLDNAGTRTKEEVKDPGGTLKRWLQRVPDALGRVQQTNGRE